MPSAGPFPHATYSALVSQDAIRAPGGSPPPTPHDPPNAPLPPLEVESAHDVRSPVSPAADPSIAARPLTRDASHAETPSRSELMPPLPAAAPFPRITSAQPPVPSSSSSPSPAAAQPPTPASPVPHSSAPADLPSFPAPSPSPSKAPAQSAPPTSSARLRPGRSPYVRAALAYAIPFIPALVLLSRERRARYVRLHAAQSLAFFLLLVLAQTALFVALVNFGIAFPDLTVSLWLSAAFLLLFALLGIGSFVIWLLLVSDAMAGRLRRYPILSRLATLIEEGATRLQLRVDRRTGYQSRVTRKE